MKAMRGSLLAVVLLALFLFPMAAAADCPPGNEGCPLVPPQSVEVNPNPLSGEGKLVDLAGGGILAPVEVGIPMPMPPGVTAVPLPNAGGGAPAGVETLEVPMRYQDPSDVSCGVQSLGMAMEGLGGGAPASSAMSSFLKEKGMMYDFGTGVEELAYTAQSFGYQESVPFHDWTLEDLAIELQEGRPVVVALGSNGENQPGHFVTVTGISASGEWVSYNDPTLGKQVVSREEFEGLWSSQGNSSVVVRKEAPAGTEGRDLTAWVALMAGLMAAISGTSLAKERKGIGGALIGMPTGGGKKPSGAAAASGHHSHVNASHGRAAAYAAAKQAAYKKKQKNKRRSRAAKAGLARRRAGRRSYQTETPEPPEAEATATPIPYIIETNDANRASEDKNIGIPNNGDDQESLLQKLADQISDPAFIWKILTDPETADLLRNMRGLPELTIALPIIKGFGFDHLSGPLLKEIALDEGVQFTGRILGRTVGDIAAGPLAAIGYGLTLMPEQIENIILDASWNERVADALIDSGGFIVSEAAGIMAGVVTSIETGPGAYGFKLLADMAAGVGWDIYIEENDIREKLTEDIEEYASTIISNMGLLIFETHDTGARPVPTPAVEDSMTDTPTPYKNERISQGDDLEKALGTLAPELSPADRVVPIATQAPNPP